jgi:hypothetical protein
VKNNSLTQKYKGAKKKDMLAHASISLKNTNYLKLGI